MTFEITITLVAVCRVVTGLVGVGVIFLGALRAIDDEHPKFLLIGSGMGAAFLATAILA